MKVKGAVRTATFLALSVASATVKAQTPIIVELRPGVSPAAVAAKTKTIYVESASGSPFHLFRTTPFDKVHAAQLRLRAHPAVLGAEDNLLSEAPENTGGGKGSSIGAVGDRNGLLDVNTNFLNQIGFVESRAIAPGRPVKVAILDTGLSIQATYLWTKVYGAVNYVEPSRKPLDIAIGLDANGDGISDSAEGHGTFVAGLVDLVAPHSQLYIVRVANSDGMSNAWQLIKGLAYSVRTGCEVVNLSLGSVNRVPALNHAVEWVESRGTLVVAPVGNRNQDQMLFPAGYNEVLSVAGVDATDHKATFSNFDQDTIACAPAVGFLSTWSDGTMGTWSGTSFAAPLVSGAIADCLKRRAKAFPSGLRGAAALGGVDIDGLNPSYQGELGRRLHIGLLDGRIQQLPIR